MADHLWVFCFQNIKSGLTPPCVYKPVLLKPIDKFNICILLICFNAVLYFRMNLYSVQRECNMISRLTYTKYVTTYLVMYSTI